MKTWLTLIVCTLPALAQHPAADDPPMRVHLTRDEAETRAKDHAKAGGARSSSPLLIDHNGPILKTTSAGAIFWGPSWGNSAFVGDKIAGLDSWYQGVTSSAYARTSDEYTDHTGQVTAAISYLGHSVDTSIAANGSQTSAILAEACKVLANGGLPAVNNGYYAVYVDIPRGHAQYCAYHSAGSCSVKGAIVPVEFGFFFHLDGDPGCDPQDASGKHSQGLAALANVTGHELSETRSDPDLNAWYDSSGSENADKCAWSFGAPLLTFTNNTQWKIQGNWSNLAFNGNLGYPNLSGQHGCLDGSNKYGPVAP
jgi:hypothetical protein